MEALSLEQRGCEARGGNLSSHRNGFMHKYRFSLCRGNASDVLFRQQ